MGKRQTSKSKPKPAAARPQSPVSSRAEPGQPAMLAAGLKPIQRCEAGTGQSAARSTCRERQSGLDPPNSAEDAVSHGAHQSPLEAGSVRGAKEKERNQQQNSSPESAPYTAQLH